MTPRMAHGGRGPPPQARAGPGPWARSGRPLFRTQETELGPMLRTSLSVQHDDGVNNSGGGGGRDARVGPEPSPAGTTSLVLFPLQPSEGGCKSPRGRRLLVQATQLPGVGPTSIPSHLAPGPCWAEGGSLGLDQWFSNGVTWPGVGLAVCSWAPPQNPPWWWGRGEGPTIYMLTSPPGESLRWPLGTPI